MKKLTMEDWGKLQSERPARYYVQSVEEGPVKVTFDSEIFVTEKGKEDVIGNIWEHEWSKVEANVTINGQKKLYSFGGASWNFIDEFMAVLSKNNISLDQLPGHVFEITKTAPFEQTIKYLGTVDEVGASSAPNAPDFKDNSFQNILDVIADLKHNSPDLIKNGLTKAEFIKICSIRGQLKSTQVGPHIAGLEVAGHIKIVNDKIFVF